VAERLAVVVVLTTDVVTGKVAEVAPAGTVTLASTWAELLSLDRVTTAPPVGAGALSATVPVEPDPPDTLDGLSVSELRTTVAAPYTA
jgi:hypothetical protein